MERAGSVTAPKSLPEAFLSACLRTPDRTFIHFEGQRFSYQAVYDHVCQIAGSFDAWGLRRGDRVALYLENAPSFIVAYLAVLWLDGVIVPVNTRYRATELRHMLLDSGARLVITDANGHSVVQNVSAELPSVERIVEVGHGLESDTTSWLASNEASPLREHVRLVLDAESLQQFCRERLASFKKPQDIYFVTSLPRNALGKVQKHLLRAQLIASSAATGEGKERSDVRA